MLSSQAAPPRPNAPSAPPWSWVLALAILYAAFARAGLTLAYFQKNATLVWVPSGLAVTSVWLWGPRMAWGAAIGSIVANLAEGTSLVVSLAFGVGAAGEALLATWLAERAKIDKRLRTVRDVVLLIAWMVLFSSAIASTNAVLWLRLLGGLPPAATLPTWFIWWLGDAGGVLVVTPLVLAFRPPLRVSAHRSRARELATLVLLSLTSVLLVFGGVLPAAWMRLPTALLPYPMLLWAALRFGMRGATAVSAFAIAGAILGTVAGTGPFSYGNLHLDVAMLWLFMATLASSAMVLAASLRERRDAEAAQREAELRLERSERLGSLGLLAGGIAHDFNNLLTVIASNVVAARTETHKNKALEAIETASQRAAELTAQLLDFAGRRPLQRTDVDVGRIAAETVRMLATSVAPNVALRESAESPRPLARGDASQLRQVVMNLVVNAAEAIGDAVGTVDVRTYTPTADARPAELAEGDWLVVAVEDTGRGMDEATRRRLFEPFFTTKARGRGLGMSAVQGIVRSHGGVVAVDSAVGRGTRVAVWLPAHGHAPSVSIEETREKRDRSDPPPPMPMPTSTPARAATPGARPRVLVIDDERGIRDVARLLLEDAGWSVGTAASGHEGLAALEREGADVVLVDLTMPRMSGAEVVAAIRARRPSLPVIVMSGYSEDLVAARGLDDARFLAKPFKLEELEKRLREALAEAAP